MDVIERGNRSSYLHSLRSRPRSEEHTSELQSQSNLVCRLLLEKKKKYDNDRWLSLLVTNSLEGTTKAHLWCGYRHQRFRTCLDPTNYIVSTTALSLTNHNGTLH